VIKATREYEISEDSLASFVEEECLRGPYYWCAVPDFRERYVGHCEEMGTEPLSARAVGMRLVSEYGVKPDRKTRLRLYRHIALQGEEKEGDDG
jgi:putative DNA primase/helicase